MKKPVISIVGAGGMVGNELLDLITKRKFPYKELNLFGSGKKKRFLSFKGKNILLKKPSLESLLKSDIVFFVSSDEVSKLYAKDLSNRGVWCIDDSSAFRMEKDVPLVIPEINGNLITQETRLIAGPNCTLTPLALSCYNIHRRYKIREIRISTYQSVSGAGRKAVNELFYEALSFLKHGKVKIKDKVFPHQIAFNLFPQVGEFDKNGDSVEEKKVEMELKKIWQDEEIKISCCAVRVCVIRSHSLSVWIKTEKKWDEKDLFSILLSTPGVNFIKDGYKTPVECEKKENIIASRFRKTPFENEFFLWLCGDNLYKGAALNSIQIAELILKKYF